MFAAQTCLPPKSAHAHKLPDRRLTTSRYQQTFVAARFHTTLPCGPAPPSVKAKPSLSTLGPPRTAGSPSGRLLSRQSRQAPGLRHAHTRRLCFVGEACLDLSQMRNQYHPVETW